MRGARHWLVLALVAGCAGKQAPPPVIETQEADLKSRPTPKEEPPIVTHGSGTPVPSADAGTKQPVAETGTQVTLLDAGAEPRRELRHTFVKGAKQKLKMSANTTVSGAPVPIPAIPMSGPIDTEITKLDAGNAHFKLTGGPFKTGGGGGGGSDLAGMLGGGAPQKIAGWGIVDPRGFVKEFHVTEGGMAGDAPVETGDPFPVEAVGKGARWEVKTTLQEKEGPVQQVSTYTLIKVDKKQVYTQMQRVQTPLDPDAQGASAESSGEVTFQLGGVHFTGKVTMTRKLNIGIPGMGESPIKMSSEMTIGKR